MRLAKMSLLVAAAAGGLLLSGGCALDGWWPWIAGGAALGVLTSAT
jgi:hypothetical protein